MSFRGRTIYITGASAGIGAELARQLAASGARLALFARRRELLEALLAEAKALGAEAAAFPCDVTDRDEVLKAFAEAARRLGPADMLIASAGVGYPVNARRFNAEKAAHILDVNVVGVFNAVEAVLPAMLERRDGHIVGLSSLAAYGSAPGSVVYCASKAALSSFLHGLRLELRRHGVAVTTICPGFIRTEMTAANQLPMPLLLDCDVATRKIIAAIKRRAKVYNFPKLLYWGVRLSQWLPDALLALAPSAPKPPKPRR